MDDKEFEEIMQKYVASTSRGKETDFKKLRQLQSQRQVPQRRKSFKPKYALVGVLCSIILVLAVVLPTTLLTKDTDSTGTDIIYSNMEDIYINYVESTDVLIDTYNLNAKYLNISSDNIIAALTSKNHKSFIGANITSYSINEDISNVSNYIINKKYIINELRAYFNFSKNIVWGEYTVGYAMILDEASNNMKYQMYFTDGNYDYFLDVTGRIGMEIEDILNTLYTE